MSIRRATLADTDALKELLNDPVIRPTIGGDGELDPAILLSDKRNICLFDERGGAMFRWSGPRIYEGHSFFRVKGREAIRLGREILSQIDAQMIWGNTPESNRAAQWFNRQLGFKSLGMNDTPEGRCELFVLEK